MRHSSDSLRQDLQHDFFHQYDIDMQEGLQIQIVGSENIHFLPVLPGVDNDVFPMRQRNGTVAENPVVTLDSCEFQLEKLVLDLQDIFHELYLKIVEPNGLLILLINY